MKPIISGLHHLGRPRARASRIQVPRDLPPSLRGALATKQSIARRTRLWIASLTGRRLAPSRWLAMTARKSLIHWRHFRQFLGLNDDMDRLRTSKSQYKARRRRQADSLTASVYGQTSKLSNRILVLPSPREAAGRGRGWGVYRQEPLLL